MKQLSRKLKRCGIYVITNLIDGNKYIGSSKDILFRLQSHRSNLRKNRHYNPHLLNAWNKYGELNFDYSVLEFCEESDRIRREQYYVNTLKPEYNISLDIVELPSYSYESRLKHSETRKRLMQEGVIPKTHLSKLFVYKTTGEFVGEFPSLSEASRQLGLTIGGIGKTLRGENKQHHGYLLFRTKQEIVPIYKRLKDVSKQFKLIIVENSNERYEFNSAKECSKYFKVHIVSVRGAILYKRKFLNKYMIYYKSAVS